MYPDALYPICLAVLGNKRRELPREVDLLELALDWATLHRPWRVKIFAPTWHRLQNIDILCHSYLIPQT